LVQKIFMTVPNSHSRAFDVSGTGCGLLVISAHFVDAWFGVGAFSQEMSHRGAGSRHLLILRRRKQWFAVKPAGYASVKWRGV
jgi:hypothetical protein